MRRALVLIALLALAGCKPEAEEAAPIRPVLTIEAKVRTQETLGPFAGSIQPRYSTDYSFRLFGRMVSRPVNVGCQPRSALMRLVSNTKSEAIMR